MSELKVNKISPSSGTAFTLGDSGDTFTVPSGATLTVAGTLTQSGAQTFDGGVEIDNFTINGTEIDLSSGDLTVDVAGDITLDADGGDLKFADGGTDLLSITNSSSDVVIKPLVDAKDIIFQQYDGTEVARIEDNATFNVSSAGKFAYAGTAVTATAGELNLLDGGTSVGGSITLADADGVVVNDGGTMKTIPASDIKTYAGFTATTITGTTALAAQPASDDEIIISDGGTLKRLDIKHIQSTPAFHAYLGSNQTVANNTVTRINFNTELFDSDGCYDNSSNYRFTPGIAGKYFLYYQMKNHNQTDYIYSRIRKNGSDIQIETHYTGADVDDFARGFTIVDSDADDYFDVHLQQTKGGDQTVGSGAQNTFFGGFRIAGV